MTTYPPRFCLFAGGKDHLDEAKKYVKRFGLTSEDVKITSNGKEILVMTKKEVKLKEVDQQNV